MTLPVSEQRTVSEQAAQTAVLILLPDSHSSNGPISRLSAMKRMSEAQGHVRVVRTSDYGRVMQEPHYNRFD